MVTETWSDERATLGDICYAHRDAKETTAYLEASLPSSTWWLGYHDNDGR